MWGGSISPLLIPVVGTVAGCAMIVAIVALLVWSGTRRKELQIHQEMRIREMEHERNMKQLELEIARTRAGREG